MDFKIRKYLKSKNTERERDRDTCRESRMREKEGGEIIKKQNLRVLRNHHYHKI